MSRKKTGTNNEVSRSWFVVLNNPAEHGYPGEPQDVVNKLREEWITDHSGRSGAWVYCISKDGLHHVHMVLEDTIPMRFSKIKKTYAIGAHLEPTKGNAEQIEAYLSKKPPFDEKGEQVVCQLRAGKIEGRLRISRGHDILADIEQRLDAGMTPDQICHLSIYYQKYESLIRRCYIERIQNQTPIQREVKVYWHVGESSTGKTHTVVRLCKEYGEKNVFIGSDYLNKGTSLFDFYCGQPCIFLDEYKGELPYGFLLSLLRGYKIPIHCRYCNTYSLWNEVHITSIYPPELIFSKCVEQSDSNNDPLSQLLNRITEVVYHFKENGNYKEFHLPGKKYTNYDILKRLVKSTLPDNFIDVTDTDDIPFDKGGEK